MPQYHMRKKEKQITDPAEIDIIIQKSKYSVIAMSMDNQPYLVSLSHGYDKKENALYYHCAAKGRKIDYIRSNPNVCATIIDDGGYQQECNHHYTSIVIFGKMEFMEDLEDKKHGINILFDHLEDNPDIIRKREIKSDKSYKKVQVLKLTIEELTAKYHSKIE